MKRKTYEMLEAYMSECAADSAHDREHIYRVLGNALEIAGAEKNVDRDVLIAACLLHDIGRGEQRRDPSLCHAEVGSEKAGVFLLEQGFSREFAQRVADCILTHRFRKNRPPESPEAKILFDADKLDVTGAIGIARTLMFQGDGAQPLYTRLPDGSICDGTGEAETSFFQEYKFKLERLYDRFFTDRGAALARQRQEAAVGFYRSLYREVCQSAEQGKELLCAFIEQEETKC